VIFGIFDKLSSDFASENRIEATGYRAWGMEQGAQGIGRGAWSMG